MARYGGTIGLDGLSVWQVSEILKAALSQRETPPVSHTGEARNSLNANKKRTAEEIESSVAAMLDGRKWRKARGNI